MSTDPEPLIAEFRHKGRMYRAECLPNGRTEVFRDGTWVCAGDWNERVLDIGRFDLTYDVEETEFITQHLAEGLADALAAEPSKRLNPRTKL